jgi:hypothetical protein
VHQVGQVLPPRDLAQLQNVQTASRYLDVTLPQEYNLVFGIMLFTMRMNAVVVICNNPPVLKQTSPINFLQNTFKIRSVLAGLFILIADKQIYRHVISAVMLICSNRIYRPRLMNCWLPAKTWVEAAKKIGGTDASSLVFKAHQFYFALATRSSSFGSVMSTCDGSTKSGMFCVSFQHRNYYYSTQQAKQLVYPKPFELSKEEGKGGGICSKFACDCIHTALSIHGKG